MPDRPPCEICGEPAVVAVLDTQVAEPPVTDEQGRSWSCCSGRGGHRVRCGAHPYHTRHEMSEAYKQWQAEEDRKWRERIQNA